MAPGCRSRMTLRMRPEGFQSAFAMEPVSPGQSAIANGIQRALAIGIQNAAQYLNNNTLYKGLPMQLNVPNPPPPNVYQVPK